MKKIPIGFENIAIFIVRSFKFILGVGVEESIVNAPLV
jgi:hypothetical protein